MPPEKSFPAVRPMLAGMLSFSAASCVGGERLFGLGLLGMFLPKAIMKCPNCGYDLQGSDPADDLAEMEILPWL